MKDSVARLRTRGLLNWNMPRIESGPTTALKYVPVAAMGNQALVTLCVPGVAKRLKMMLFGDFRRSERAGPRSMSTRRSQADMILVGGMF